MPYSEQVYNRCHKFDLTLCVFGNRISFAFVCVCANKRKNNQSNIHKTNVKSVYFQHVHIEIFPSAPSFFVFLPHVWWFWCFYTIHISYKLTQSANILTRDVRGTRETCHKFDCEPHKANSYRIYFWWYNAKEATDSREYSHFFWWLLKRVVSSNHCKLANWNEIWWQSNRSQPSLIHLSPGC